MGLIKLENSTPVDEIVGVLRRDGGVVVCDLVPQEIVTHVNNELQACFDEHGANRQDEFTGMKTLRATGVLSRAPSAAALVAHATILQVADSVLLPHCAAYLLGSMVGIRVLPGQTAQPLHRDDTIYPLLIPGMDLQIGVIWALDDFTEQNGGTRVVPGSHRIMRAWHSPKLAESVAAVMSKGSALLYLGSTWHGAGENRANMPRTALVKTYCLGWLRTEANLYLEVPPEEAA